MFHLIVTYLSVHREDVLKLAGGAAGLSVILESFLLKLKRGFKLPFSKKVHSIDSKALSFTLLHILTIATAAATYVLGNLPKMDTGAIYATLTIAAEVWHRFVVSPFYSKYLVPFLEYLQDTKDQTSTPPPPVTSSLDPSGSVPSEAFLGQE